jgi:hypothetical protein
MSQTTGILDATNVKFKAAETGGTVAIIGKVKDCSVSVSTDMQDVTTKDSDGWREQRPGLKSATVSIGAFVSYDENTNLEEFQALQLAGTALDMEITVGTTSGVGGDKAYTATGYIESVEVSSAYAESQEFTVNFAVTGAVAFAEQA